jgi:hypothetical protein
MKRLAKTAVHTSKPTVFIAHRSDKLDTRVAEQLADELKLRDISYFLDKDTLKLGDDFQERILSAVGSATIVVVLFPQSPSSWVAFEAACAFFEQKLLPVSLAGSQVPEPYNRLQTYTIDVVDQMPSKTSIEAIVLEIEQKLFGTQTDRRWIIATDLLNRVFEKGLQVTLGAFFVVGLLMLAYDFSIRDMSRGLLILHLNHLHVILGATILGGQLFVSLAFAQAISSPIHPTRDAAFRSAERLFFFWLWLTPFQPMLGVALALAKYGEIRTAPAWSWLALVLYLIGLLFTCTAYGVARANRKEPLSAENRKNVGYLNLLANVLFLLGFIVTVLIINLMLWKPWT